MSRIEHIMRPSTSHISRLGDLLQQGGNMKIKVKYIEGTESFAVKYGKYTVGAAKAMNNNAVKFHVQ